MTDEFLSDVLCGGTTEVLRVSDGYIFIFTKEKLEFLLNAARSAGKAVVFVKQAIEGDVN